MSCCATECARIRATAASRDNGTMSQKKKSSFIPRISPKSHETHAEPANAFNWIAVAVVWIVVISLAVGLYLKGAKGYKLTEVLDGIGLCLTVAGTVWVGAGVVYHAPTNPFQTVAQLQAHTVAALSVASRHCKIGISMFLVGVLMQELEKWQYIIDLQ